MAKQEKVQKGSRPMSASTAEFVKLVNAKDEKRNGSRVKSSVRRRRKDSR